jgi:cysteinyl-tRNA synthetase
MLSVHYRKQLRFTWASLGQAEEAMRRLMDFLARLDAVRAGEAHPALQARVGEARTAFREMLEADLNTAGGLGVVFDLVRAVNAAIDAGDIGQPDVAVVRGAFEGFDHVLGVIDLRRREDAEPPIPMADIERLIGERREARRRRDFAAADRVRAELADRGVLVEDTPAGTRWKRK